MAATLTQERFTGPEWIFERKFDGIRLLAFKTWLECPAAARATACRRTSPAVADAIADAAGERNRFSTARSTWAYRSGRLSRVRHHVARRPRRHRAAARRPARTPGRVAAAGAAAPCHAARRRPAVGARVQRRLGRRHREAARLALRAPPLAALAQDEVRGVAGAGRRRVHRSAGRTRRARRAAGRLLRWRRLRVCRKGRHGVRHEAAARAARAARRARDPDVAVHEERRACRASARTGSGRRSSCRSRFIEWTVHGKLRHPRFLGVRTDKAAREVVRETP